MTLIPLGFFGGGSSASFELISTQVLASTATSVTFSSIPQTYKHLQMRLVLRSDRAGNSAETYKVILNSDSGTNYISHSLRGNGSAVLSTASAASAYIDLLATSGIAISDATTWNASVYGSSIMDLTDYTSTIKNKTVRIIGGVAETLTNVGMVSGLWQSTAAVTTINISPRYGSNFVAGSRISLYGIKG